MDFVIFSYNYLPQNNPEAFCTARFANALAEAGHHVHVVTMERPADIPADLVKELVPAKMDITRVPMKPLKKNLWARIHYQTPEWDAINYDNCIRVLRCVLKQYDKPILVSRMCPDASGIIAWPCRKDAALWINHFSDPFPNYLKGGLLGSLVNKFTYRWARRFLSDSAFCTITCPDVIRFFNDYVMQVSDERFVLVPHIGDPLIQPDPNWRSPYPNKPYIAHAGNCYDGRYAKELVREMRLCKEQGCDIALLQAGEMLQKDKQVLAESGVDFKILPMNSPREASSIFLDATINLVIDLKVNYPGYTPFIPSKFVYLLFTNKPIVVFAQKNSWMCRLAREYPDAGIYVADVRNEGELSSHIQWILKQNDMTFDRYAIRQRFSKSEAIDAFVLRSQEFLSFKH